MRAFFLRDEDSVTIGDIIALKDDRSHHLIKVCRIKQGQEVAALDGEGTIYSCEVLEAGRRDCSLKVVSKETFKKSIHIDVLLGLPKREAFELSLKNSVELGVGKIIPFIPKFGQWNIKNFDRVNLLVESALVQSNNPFFMKVEEPRTSLEACQDLFKEYDAVILTTLKSGRELSKLKVDKSKKYLIVIGPEGGLDESEEEFILTLENSYSLKLDTPILRTPNAVSAVIGFMHGKFAGL